MKRYESYKPSNIEEVGVVPREWGLTKLKYVASLFNGDSLNQEKKELFSDPIDGYLPYISSKDINVDTHEINYQNGLGIGHEYLAGYKQCRPNSTLICIEGGSAGRKIGFTHQACTFVNKLCAIEGLEHSKFIYYYTQSNSFQDKFRLSITGLIGGVSISELKNFSIPQPSLAEQSQIVAYLDRKTALIDSLIAKTERKIALLKEKRTALINQAVTKGLDPNVPMKDSGVEWIGEIPEHWSFLPIKYLTQSSKDSIRTGPFGSAIKTSDYQDEGVRVYNQRAVYDEDFSKSEIFVSPEKAKELASFNVMAGDVLVTSRGTIGKMTVVPENGEEGVLHPCLIRLRLNNKVASRFLWYYMNQSSLFLETVLFESDSTTIEVIYSDTLANSRIAIPDVNEQKQIVEFLEKKVSELDLMIKNQLKEVEKLKEYRQALISEVVTGKIKVSKDV